MRRVGAPEAAATALAAAGALVAVYSNLVLGSTPLAALGVGAAIVGASIALTSAEAPYRDYLVSAAESALGNVARILEELGASGRAVYVPGDGNVYIAVPLRGEPDPGSLGPAKLEGQLLATVGGVDYLVLEPPVKPPEPGADPEAAASTVLVDLLGVADSVKVTRAGEEIVAEVSGVRAAGAAGRMRVTMGSLVSCVVCSAAASGYGAPVVFGGEERRGGSVVVRAVLAGGRGELELEGQAV